MSLSLQVSSGIIFLSFRLYSHSLSTSASPFLDVSLHHHTTSHYTHNSTQHIPHHIMNTKMTDHNVEMRQNSPNRGSNSAEKTLERPLAARYTPAKLVWDFYSAR